MSRGPRVVLGLPAYCRPDTLGRTLESLLSQTYHDFALVICDDAPSMEAEPIVDSYRAWRSLAHYERNQRRLGMVGNWRHVFARARQLYPASEYFAWVSDHDLWHARWLEKMVAALDANPDVVLAYPEHFQIRPDPKWGGSKTFDTVGIRERSARLRRSALHMLAGDMIYGLMRVEALEAAGVFRYVITPDRQVLLSLSLFGEVRQVPEVLWYREFLHRLDMTRQREAFFPDGVPLYAHMPWQLQHFATMLWDFALCGRGRPSFGRAAGLWYAMAQLWCFIARNVMRPKTGLRVAIERYRPGRWVKSRLSAPVPAQNIPSAERRRRIAVARKVAQKAERLERELEERRRAKRAAAHEQKAERLERELEERRRAKRAAAHEQKAERLERELEERRRAERAAAHEVGDRAYQSYLAVRDRVRTMQQVTGGSSACRSDAERQMLAGLAHLWDASPDTIACLREHCEPISGVRASDYVDVSSDLEMRLRRDVGRLRRVTGDARFVQESPLLGGFGIERNKVRFNQDTARYFNALVALEDAGVLGGHEGTGSRHLVWEVGGGWGGFAYQFKTVCPRVTYLITGPPEMFLVSAVYLQTLHPNARVRFFGEVATGDLWRDWTEIDFLFVPESALPTLRPPRVDLMVDIMALRQMTESGVQLHLQQAFDVGCRFVYSLRGRGLADNTDAVWNAIGRLYWPHDIPGRVELNPDEADVPGLPNSEAGYDHLIGWRRMLV